MFRSPVTRQLPLRHCALALLPNIWHSQAVSSQVRLLVSAPKQLPSISLKFATCDEYMKNICSGLVEQSVSAVTFSEEELTFIRKQVENTLPASVDNPNPVNSLSITPFIFKHCAKHSLPELAFSWAHFISNGQPSSLTGINGNAFFMALASCDWTKRDLADSDVYVQFENLLLDKLSCNSDNRDVAFLAALANSSHWLKAHKLWNESVDVSNKECRILFHNLAMSSLRNKDYPKFWAMLKSDFVTHTSYQLSLNELSRDGILDQLIIAWIQHCKGTIASNTTHGSTQAWQRLNTLCHFFRAHLISLSSDIESELMELLQMLDCSPQRVLMPKKGTCVACDTHLESIKSMSVDIERLRQSVLSQTLMSHNKLYQNSSPEEVEAFLKKIDDPSLNYDIVVDGLNASMKRKPLNVRNMSLTLFEVIKDLKAMNMKPLLIHRYELSRYPHYQKLKSMCDMVLLNKVSNDDIFVLVAALSKGPFTKLLSGDLFRQHKFLIKGKGMSTIFDVWQVTHQVQMAVNVEGKIRFRFPLHYLPRSTLRNGHWHVPLVDLDLRDGDIPISKNWICFKNKAPKCDSALDYLSGLKLS